MLDEMNANNYNSLQMKTMKIKDVCLRMHSGGTPSTKHPEYWNGSIPWLSSSESGKNFINDASQFITEEGVKNSATRQAKKDSVIIATAGEGKTRGQVSYLNIDAYINQSLIAMQTNPAIMESKYLYYYLKNSYTRLRTLSNITGVRGSLSGSLLADFDITFPELNEQKKVVSLLSSLDSKISLNEQINRNLEELARLIYDYWFVQFDFPDKNGKPYKSSGGKMVWNEKLKRDIPAGWQTAKVRDVILPIERGISYSSDEITDPNGTPMINLACFDKKGNYRTGEFKYFTGKYKNEDKVYPFDMLIACTDLTQKADIIGTPIFAPTECPFYVFSMDLVKITPIRSNDKQFLYYYLKHPAFHHYIKPFASGTTVKHLRVDGLLDYPIFMPDESVRDAFAEVMEPIRQKIADNTSHGVELSKMRDFLLPLLMNGQVSVKSSNRSK